jgi:hypothetical protein
MSPTPTSASSSRRVEAGQQEGRKIQREIDVIDAKASNESSQEPKAMQAGTREYPTDFPPQHHAKPGHEREIRPAPMYEAPGYKGSEKLKGKVALVTGATAGSGGPLPCFTRAKEPTSRSSTSMSMMTRRRPRKRSKPNANDVF